MTRRLDQMKTFLIAMSVAFSMGSLAASPTAA
jgi:hypothetical protein